MILQTRRSDPHNLRYCRSAQQNRIGLKRCFIGEPRYHLGRSAQQNRIGLKLGSSIPSIPTDSRSAQQNRIGLKPWPPAAGHP